MDSPVKKGTMKITNHFALMILTVGMLLMTTGCATIVGYNVGASLDVKSGTSEPYAVEFVDQLKNGQLLEVTLKDGRVIRGVLIEKHAGRDLCLSRVGSKRKAGADWIALDKIQSISLIHITDDNRHKWTAVGIVTDLVTVGILYALKSIGEGMQALSYNS